MYDPISQRTINLLHKESIIFVAIEVLYEQLLAEALMARLDSYLLRRLLETIPELVVIEGLEEVVFVEAELLSLEALHILDGPWVALRARLASPSEVIGDVLRHVHEMNTVLEQAWQYHAPHDPQLKADLLSMLMVGDLLERQVIQTLRETLTEPLDAHRLPPLLSDPGWEVEP
jgi:hypothetical protein